MSPERESTDGRSALHPEGLARQDKGGQLVARAQRPYLPVDAPLLAQGYAAFDLARLAKERGSHRMS